MQVAIASRRMERSRATCTTGPSFLGFPVITINSDDLGCNRGYEWWLLEQARARNPDIKTYALSWAVPYWVWELYVCGSERLGGQPDWLLLSGAIFY